MPGDGAAAAANEAWTFRRVHKSLTIRVATKTEESCNENAKRMAWALAGAALAFAARRGAGADAEARRNAQFRDQRRDAALRLPRQRHLRDPAFRGAVLFDAAAVQSVDKFPEVEGDLAESWTVAPDLHDLHASSSASGVKFHDGTALTSADVKATYDRLRNPPQGVVSTRKATFADIGTIETPDPLTIVFKMKAVNASMLEHFASPWNCIYAAKDLSRGPECAEDQDQRHRAVHLRRARQGQPRRRQEERRLFQAGPALSRRLQGHLHAAGGRHAQCAAGRAGAGRVPRHLAGRARPAGAAMGDKHPHRGIELDAQPADRLQCRRRSRSTTCACAGRC